MPHVRLLCRALVRSALFTLTCVIALGGTAHLVMAALNCTSAETPCVRQIPEHEPCGRHTPVMVCDCDDVGQAAIPTPGPAGVVTAPVAAPTPRAASPDVAVPRPAFSTTHGRSFVPLHILNTSLLI